MKVIAVDLDALIQHQRPQWGAEQQEELCKCAELFRTNGDTVGVHLCAAAEQEIKRCEDSAGCNVLGLFFIMLILLRRANGADHELAHLILPGIVDMWREAHRQADLARLAKESGIDI